MRNLSRPAWMYAKAALFVFAGLLSAVLLLVEHPTFRVAFLLALTVWSFCRAYYFAFYVVERYVGSGFRFSGLFSFAAYLLRVLRATKATAPPSH